MSKRRSTASEHLDIPRKSVELQDPGAHDLSSEEEYYSDASEGRRKLSRPVTPTSPIPTTRVEKVDDEPSYGEQPGTEAYEKRKKDAVPDEIELVPEGRLSKRSSRQSLEVPRSPGGTPIPRTVVERVDPTSPSHGEIPGTEAYKQRLADAAPDLILNNPDQSKSLKFLNESGRPRTHSGASIPETIITKADDEPAFGPPLGFVTAKKDKSNTSSDEMETEKDATAASDDGMNDNELGDDFDDFEEGAQTAADDDFGDFDDFEEGVEAEQSDPTPVATTSYEQTTSSAFPLIDSDALSTLQDLLEATKLHLDAMFPSTIIDHSTQTKPEPISTDSPIFPSDRSRSLWKQLITPPPLQPPNWTQSRIRRLFLISLGVPVDLDEILPPSKQKKLILPDIDLPSRSIADNSRQSTDNDKATHDSISKLKHTRNNDSTASVDSQQSASKSGRGRTRPASAAFKQTPAPPPLDLNAVKRICATTNEKLEGFTDDELKAHVKELEQLTERTSTVLEFWLKRRDGLRKEKEAFEGVIENLVRHAKRVRTIK